MTEDAKELTERLDRLETAVKVLTKLKESFPKTAPYSKDPLKFARNYIEVMQKWATENLGVVFDE